MDEEPPSMASMRAPVTGPTIGGPIAGSGGYSRVTLVIQRIEPSGRE
jgi:hypothetical protein